MNMVEVKTSELEGAALDWAVAQVEDDNLDLVWKSMHGDMIGFGTIGSSPEFPCLRISRVVGSPSSLPCYRPSTDWAQCGPLIDKHHIQTSYNGNYFSQSPTREYWCAYVCKPSGQEERPSGGGPTALIALCRAIVAAHSGDVVSVPAELIGPPK